MCGLIQLFSPLFSELKNIIWFLNVMNLKLYLIFWLKVINFTIVFSCKTFIILHIRCRAPHINFKLILTVTYTSQCVLWICRVDFWINIYLLKYFYLKIMIKYIGFSCKTYIILHIVCRTPYFKWILIITYTSQCVLCIWLVNFWRNMWLLNFI